MRPKSVKKFKIRHKILISMFCRLVLQAAAILLRIQNILLTFSSPFIVILLSHLLMHG